MQIETVATPTSFTIFPVPSEIASSDYFSELDELESDLISELGIRDLRTIEVDSRVPVRYTCRFEFDQVFPSRQFIRMPQGADTPIEW